MIFYGENCALLQGKELRTIMNRIEIEKEYKLFTPGPTNIPNRVEAASSLCNYHHRTASFSAVLKDTLGRLKALFGTDGDILPIHATGRGALEGVYKNLFTSESKVISVANGSFGEMAVNTLKKNGIPCIPFAEGWETEVDIGELEDLVKKEKPTGITCVWNDTSNGIVNPIWSIGEIAKKYDLLFVVDAVSALGCMPFEFDNWHVDAAVVASQKGLMSATGMSFAAVSDRAMEAAGKNTGTNFYINLPDIKRFVDEKMETPGSTPVPLVLSVNEALNMMEEEGLENVFKRHKALSSGTKAALEALGFSLYPLSWSCRSDSLTVARVPEGVDPPALVKHLSDNYSLLIGKGLKQTGKSCIRIAHMGYCYVQDMLECITAIEASFDELGYGKCYGIGTESFMREYRKIW